MAETHRTGLPLSNLFEIWGLYKEQVPAASLQFMVVPLKTFSPCHAENFPTGNNGPKSVNIIYLHISQFICCLCLTACLFDSLIYKMPY